MSVKYYNLKDSGLEEFKDFILPDVFDELRFEDILNMPGIICVGAADAVGPVGAIIINLGENSEAEIASIYVDKNKRDKGVGSGLISEALSQILFTLERNSRIVNPTLGVKIHIDFNLPEADYPRFKKFLKAAGFSMQADLGESFLLTKTALDSSVLQNVKIDDAKAISDYAGDENWDEIASMSGMDIKPELCFFTGPNDKPDTMLLTQYGYAGDYYFITNYFSEKTEQTDVNLATMLAKTLALLKKENPNFTVMVNSEFNIESSIWKQIASKDFGIALHGEAVMPAVFLSKGGKLNA